MVEEPDRVVAEPVDDVEGGELSVVVEPDDALPPLAEVPAVSSAHPARAATTARALRVTRKSMPKDTDNSLTLSDIDFGAGCHGRATAP